MRPVRLVAAMLALLAAPVLAAGNIARCLQHPPADPAAPLVIDVARLSGTARRPAGSKLQAVRVEVRLSLAANQRLPEDLQVQLVDDRGSVVTLEAADSASGMLRAGRVRPGSYVVRVAFSQPRGPALLTPTLRTLLDQDVNRVHLHLRRSDQGVYRSGNGLVAYTPSSSVAILAPSTRAAGGLLKGIDATMRRQSPAWANGEVGEALDRSRGRLLVLPLKSRDNADVVVRTLRASLPNQVRVGRVIDLGGGKGAVRVYDNRYVLRFTPASRADAGRRDLLLAEAGFRIVRRYQHDADLVIAQAAADSPPQDLATIDCLVAEELLVTGEPDIITPWATAAPPDDPQFADQSAAHRPFANQRIVQAWSLLSTPGRLPVASSKVFVGLIDQRIDPNDEELNCQVDGMPQVATCWDTDTMAACPGGPVPAQHGMAMLGVIAACTHNGKQIAGIAPGVRINALAFDRGGLLQYYSGEQYADLLMWLGGTREPCENWGPWDQACAWPLVRSDVINNSYTLGTWEGWNDDVIPLPELVGYAFETLLQFGRDGKGTVLVYAAGNWKPAKATEVIAPTAADPRTIGVSNCFYDPEQNVERLDDGALTAGFGSNIGEKVDLCANGRGALTILAACAPQVQGPCDAHGTSAAAATVSAVVALMLTANPELSWQQVGDILRDTAEHILPWPGAGGPGQGNDRSLWYGAGRVNAEAAVRAAMCLRPAGCAGP
jgi:hypothetical protein